jgi:hypothetical protein
LRKRIILANKYIRFAQEHVVWGQGYFGSTVPVLIEYTKPIRVSPGGNSVRVAYKDHAEPGRPTREKEWRFDVRDPERAGDLRYEITNYIIRAIKNGAKEDGIEVPSFK